MIDHPEGIIVTVSQGMYKTHGYRHWLRNFLTAMADENTYYWLRQGACPKRSDLQYVYLCIGGKIRFRCIYAGCEGEGEVKFDDGRRMFGKAWAVMVGPVVRAPYLIRMHGFRGFRYTEKLF